MSENKKPGSNELGNNELGNEEFEVVDIEIDDDDDVADAVDSVKNAVEEAAKETAKETASVETAVEEAAEKTEDKAVTVEEAAEEKAATEAVEVAEEIRSADDKAEETAETVAAESEAEAVIKAAEEAAEETTVEAVVEAAEETVTEAAEETVEKAVAEDSEEDTKAAKKAAKAAEKAAEKEEKKKNKSKMPRWAKIVIGVCIGLLVIALGVFIGVKIYLSRVPRIEERERLDRSSETFETTSGLEDATDSIDPDEVNWDSLYQEIKADSDVKNILLIGQDGRPGDASNTRSDSMILCSINKKTNKITLVSFMRDMYVPIPGYSDNRINASYSFGGAALLKETIEADFGISIDNCMEVNFDGFIKAMSAVGDLEIELTEAEAKYLNEMGNAMNKEEGLPDAEWNLKEGKNILRPDQALAYSRTRYVGRSDYERTERQRKVLTAAFNKVSKLSTSEQVDLANAIIPYIATDMTDMEILGYVYYVATDGLHVGDSYRVPADKTYTNETIRSMMVLVPSLTQNSELLKEWLYQGVN